MAAKKKPPRKPKPGYLGAGTAAKAGRALVSGKKRNCAAMGGKWVGGKCVF